MSNSIFLQMLHFSKEIPKKKEKEVLQHFWAKKGSALYPNEKLTFSFLFKIHEVVLYWQDEIL